MNNRNSRLKNAGIESARATTGDDLYYLGMLLSPGDADAALATMRFCKDDPDGEKAQAARNVVVLYSIKKGRGAGGGDCRGYARHQPQNPTIAIAWSF